ncbi:MAG: GNAT family N-acetyltransferase [Alphaproteobacteria bacterium]|nr:GNAT family N-acetyltransferase [Alphaproteobacteria bacterium]
MKVTLRPARTSDSAALSDLAMRSKAHWGYDAAFLEACRAELTITPERIEAEQMTVAEERGALVGMIALAAEGAEGEIEDFFVSPEAIGQGIGRRLMEHALSQARAAGLARIGVDADPNAEAIYVRFGFVRIGLSLSASIPGRMLPRLERAVEAAAP